MLISSGITRYRKNNRYWDYRQSDKEILIKDRLRLCKSVLLHFIANSDKVLITGDCTCVHLVCNHSMQGMSKLLELAEENRNIIVSISLGDLIECNEELIRRAKAELEQQITDAAAETYPSVTKVAEILDANKTAFWRWTESGNLVPIEIGGKRRYRMSDVKRILTNTDTAK